MVRFRELIPWRSFAIWTSWSPRVAVVELKKVIDKPSRFGAGGDAPFVGDLAGSETEFRFWRRIAYRNSFLPRIRVFVEPLRRGGTCLLVQMRLHPFVAVFMGLWMTGATIGGLVVAVAFFYAGKPEGLVGVALPVFGFGLTTVPFAIEARKAEKLLRAVYAAAPAPPELRESSQPFR